MRKFHCNSRAFPVHGPEAEQLTLSERALESINAFSNRIMDPDPFFSFSMHFPALSASL